MINYTERLSQLMDDIVVRLPALARVDMSRVLVFARAGRTDSEGPYATCHCLCLPPSEPGYYYWMDSRTGALTRRSEWFVTRSPKVRVGDRRIDYMISFTLPRFCDQRLVSERKRRRYEGQPDWVVKLDTIVHELYHIDPDRPGIRRIERADGSYSANSHGPSFFEDVAEMVTQYLATHPDPALTQFLQYDFAGLTAQYGGVLATAFRAFPSYPRRYVQIVEPQPDHPSPDCPVEALKVPRVATEFTEDDLTVREFLPDTSRAVVRKGKFRAA